MEIHPVLIDRCIKQDRTAQRELYDTLLPYLNLICKRYLRNTYELSDVLQEIFIRIFKNLELYNPQRAKFKTWVTQIAINYCIKQNRFTAKSKIKELIVPVHEKPTLPSINEVHNRDELLHWIKRMPAPYFQVFNLFVVDGFSHAEIAELLKIDITLSRKRLARSRKWLKEQLPEALKFQFRQHYN